MRFAAIEWILFVPLLIGAAFIFRKLRLWQPLRALCLVCLALILLQPQIRKFGRGLDLWVLVDRSASAADAIEPRRAEMQSLLERTKGTEDRIFYVDFADLAQLRDEGDPIPPTRQQQTRTATAIQFALSRMASDRASRLLVLTDGYSTEPLTNLGERLVRQQVPLDYRLVTLPNEADYRLEALNIPTRAQPGEPFMVELNVAGEPDGSVPYEILRDGEKIGAGQISIARGNGAARFTDRLAQAGSHKYTARISPAGDTRPGNNFGEKWIEITGGPRILLATSYTDDPVAKALAAQGFQVETITDLTRLNVGSLSGAKAVILNNVPAHLLPPEFLASLPFYVNSQGGGLLMAGGKFSFGAGGYFNSPVDELLPVSMELRTEHRKLATAMAIVMDRSGSMSASVAGGMQKMDLADEGAARSIDLLGPMDLVTVFAVDTEAHRIIPLSSLGSNRGSLTNTVRRIASEGGGICVPTGLRAAATELAAAQTGQRHVVLFADANDATQELGDYPTLVKNMVKNGITISVIGLGTDHDSGAQFLREIADLGKGRIFFNENPADLPAVFAQETVAVARSAFLTDPVKVTPTAGWLELAAKPLQWPNAVDGYNLSYLKPHATAAAFSADEYAAPLTAFWQRGAGRAAAVSFPLGGDFSQSVRSWPRYGDFLQTLGRWLMGEELPAGLGLRTRLEGTELQLDLFYDESWEQRIAQNAPHIMLSEGASGAARELVWEKLEPGHFKTSSPLQPEQWVRGAAQVGQFTFPFGPVMAGSSVEWTFDRARLLELQNVSRVSGGVERVDLSKIWQAPRRSEWRDLRPWLLIALLAAFLADVLLTRLGWQLPNFQSRKIARVHSPKTSAQIAEKPPLKSPVIAAAPPVSPELRKSRFERAKHEDS